jgi:hypothetical protein
VDAEFADAVALTPAGEEPPTGMAPAEKVAETEVAVLQDTEGGNAGVGGPATDPFQTSRISRLSLGSLEAELLEAEIAAAEASLAEALLVEGGSAPSSVEGPGETVQHV